MVLFTATAPAGAEVVTTSSSSVPGPYAVIAAHLLANSYAHVNYSAAGPPSTIKQIKI